MTDTYLNQTVFDTCIVIWLDTSTEIPLGWPIYVKAKADEIWIRDYSHQLGFCYIMLTKANR